MALRALVGWGCPSVFCVIVEVREEGLYGVEQQRSGAWIGARVFPPRSLLSKLEPRRIIFFGHAPDRDAIDGKDFHHALREIALDGVEVSVRDVCRILNDRPLLRGEPLPGL